MGLTAAAIMERENLRRNLLITISHHPEGLAVSQLCREYERLHRVKLDIQHWGYYSVVKFCAMFPQVFTLAHDGAVGSRWMLYSSCRPDCKVNKKHACTLGHEDKIPRQELLGNVKVGEYLEVIIGEVVSPEKFWIQLKGEKTNKALVRLNEEIKHFYGYSFQGYIVKDEDILSVGMVCANLHSDGYWYRAEILSFRNLTTVNVFFIDYGKVFQVKKNKLAYLPKRFGKLPGQAFEARLDGIRPAGERCHYSKEAKLRFMKLTDLFVGNKYLGLVAIVRGFGEKLSLTLVDTSTNKLLEGININQKLVHEGLAVLDARTTNQVNDNEERNTRPIISLKAKLAISKSTPKTAAPIISLKAKLAIPKSTSKTATPTDISNLPLATPPDITNLAAVALTTSGSRYLQSIIPQMKIEELNALQVILFFFNREYAKNILRGGCPEVGGGTVHFG